MRKTTDSSGFLRSYSRHAALYEASVITKLKTKKILGASKGLKFFTDYFELCNVSLMSFK